MQNQHGYLNFDTHRLKTWEMIIASFWVDNRGEKSRFFKKTILLADISMDVALQMLFLTLTNIKIKFNNRELR